MGDLQTGQAQRWVLQKGRLVAGIAAAFVMAITGFGWAGYNTTVGQIITSHVLPGVLTPAGQDQNILLMGLDSRLDQNGQPLPQEMYDALHAGDETSGGYNANVLIVVHIPGDGGPMTALSIPRDDYVDLAGCPGSVCKGKVKQAYGFAYQQALDRQASGGSDVAGANDLTAREQAAREQAERVSRAIDALVAADARARAAPLAALGATACTLPDVCAARQACLDAFTPQVQAAARQQEARALLDRRDPSLAPQVDARLDEAERLQTRARGLQEACLSAATASAPRTRACHLPASLERTNAGLTGWIGV